MVFFSGNFLRDSLKIMWQDFPEPNKFCLIIIRFRYCDLNVGARNVSIIIKNRKISIKIVKNGIVPVNTNQNTKLISTHIPAIVILQKIQKIHKKIFHRIWSQK